VSDISPNPPADSKTQEIAFLLIDDFALMSYAAAIEPLRAANLLSRRELYRWRHVSVDGQAATASNGGRVLVDNKVGDEADFDTVMVCAGGNPTLFADAATFAWIRALARKGVRLGGISGGPWMLARAGVMQGRRCTVHWEHLPAMAEAFPTLDLRRTLYEVDGDRLTCAGGIAALDMMVELIEHDHGHTLAAAVAEWYLRTELRSGSAAQRMPARERFGVSNEKLLRALAYMEARLEEPASKAMVSAAAGLSGRQLERLFAQHLGATPTEYYLRMRLDRARGLLRQTTLSVLETGIACGFVSSSHFSRAYRARFGKPPKAERATPQP
jgi:transcriptional regulator GlxA family with amidase domain